MTQVNGKQTSGTSTPTKKYNESLRQVCREMHIKVKVFLDKEAAAGSRLQSTQEQTRIALGVIRKALEDYRLNELALSFNGGKDCLVLLILYLSVLHDFFESRPSSSSSSEQSSTTITTTTTTSVSATNGSHLPQSSSKLRSYSTSSTQPLRLHTVYVASAHPFKEVDDFIDECVHDYHLNLVRYSGQSIKSAFETYLHDNPDVKAIFVGTRRTDPHGALLKHFDPTNHGWPAFLRVHPVIDWHYADVWIFLRAINVPYCCLYDQGYTSLGGRTDTHPNPALLDPDGKGKTSVNDPEGGPSKFRPAYELIADEEERLGRD